MGTELVTTSITVTMIIMIIIIVSKTDYFRLDEAHLNII
jgi:hypothetical protein